MPLFNITNVIKSKSQNPIHNKAKIYKFKKSDKNFQNRDFTNARARKYFKWTIHKEFPSDLDKRPENQKILGQFHYFLKH